MGTQDKSPCLISLQYLNQLPIGGIVSVIFQNGREVMTKQWKQGMKYKFHTSKLLQSLFHSIIGHYVASELFLSCHSGVLLAQFHATIISEFAKEITRHWVIEKSVQEISGICEYFLIAMGT